MDILAGASLEPEVCERTAIGSSPISFGLLNPPPPPPFPPFSLGGDEKYTSHEQPKQYPSTAHAGEVGKPSLSSSRCHIVSCPTG